MTPKNREELEELMIGAVNSACYPPRSTFDPVFIEVTPESIVREILGALSEAGIALVPKMATEEMCGAAWNAPCARQGADSEAERNRLRCEPLYTAMINASPYVSSATNQGGKHG